VAKKLLASLALVVVVCGCQLGSTAVRQATPSPTSARVELAEGYRLWLTSSVSSATPSLQIVDSGGRQLQHLPHGALARDGSRLYSGEYLGNLKPDTTTMLKVFEPLTGRLVQSVSLPGAYGLSAEPGGMQVGLSANGRWLAVEGNERSASATVRSDLLVYETSFASLPRRAHLDGAFGYLAIDDSGRYLYLNQQDAFAFRRYDLDAGTLDPTALSDTPPGVVSVESPGPGAWRQSDDGQRIYHLYFNDGAAFLGTLDTASGRAGYVALNVKGSSDWERQFVWTLVAPSSSTVYVVNGVLGIVIEVGTSPLMVRRTLRLPSQTRLTGALLPGLVLEAEAKRAVTSPAAMSPDGRILAIARQKGVSLIDLGRLSLLRTVGLDWTFDSIRFSPDSAWLYGVDPERAQLVQVRPADGAYSLVPGADAPMEVLRIDRLG
jgi:hypothetical protein